MFLNWLNPTRLRIYPRLIAGTTGVVLLLNAVLGKGWKGATGQIIGADFLSLYSSGIVLRQDPASLYDFAIQAKVQEALIAPTQTWGVNPFTNPPYVAEVMSWLTRLPVPAAFIFWLISSLASTALAAWLISRYLLPSEIIRIDLSAKQFFIIIISSLAFLEGFQMGQNHAFTLLLITAATVLSIRRQWLASGVVVGLLLYKPHFALSFLIIWFVWQRWNALLGFGGVAILWLGSFFLKYGLQLFREYLSLGTMLLKAEYLPERSGHLGVTPYNLLIDLLPESAWPGIFLFTLVLLTAATMGLAYYAFTQRKSLDNERYYVFILAILYPLLVSPHVLLHDMVILVPALALWANLWPGREFLNVIITVYIATFVLPLAAKITGTSVLALIPLTLIVLLVYQISRQPKREHEVASSFS